MLINGFILGRNGSLSLPVGEERAVLFPLLYSSHILSLIMWTSDKNAASRFSREGENFPAFFLLLSFHFITAEKSLLSSLYPLPSLLLADSSEDNHTHTKACRRRFTFSFVIITCNLSRCISFSRVTGVVGAGNKRVWGLKQIRFVTEGSEVCAVLKLYNSRALLCVHCSHMSDSVCIVSKGRHFQILVTRSFYAPAVTRLACHSCNNMHTKWTHVWWLMCA